MNNSHEKKVTKAPAPPAPPHTASRKYSPPRTEKSAPRINKNRKKNRTIVDLFRREGALATEFRRLADQLGWSPDRIDQGADKPHGPKHILVTSSVTGEGKSTVASLLALTTSIYLNQKTLLLDGDLRRPTVHRLFDQMMNGGLSDCLLGKATFDQCLRSTEIEKLKVLTAGTTVANPSELFIAESWSEFLAEAVFYFDRIIVDCAPVIPVDDAMVLGRTVDGILMVVRAGNTQREVANRATRIIGESRLNLLGIVVNNLDEALPFYYNQKYYGYHYHSGKK